MATKWTDKRRAHQQLPPPELRRALRQSAGLSQADIAKATGVHKSAVSRWESGTSDPTGEQLVAYVALLMELRDG